MALSTLARIARLANSRVQTETPTARPTLDSRMEQWTGRDTSRSRRALTLRRPRFASTTRDPPVRSLVPATPIGIAHSHWDRPDCVLAGGLGEMCENPRVCVKISVRNLFEICGRSPKSARRNLRASRTKSWGWARPRRSEPAIIWGYGRRVSNQKPVSRLTVN